MHAVKRACLRHGLLGQPRFAPAFRVTRPYSETATATATETETKTDDSPASAPEASVDQASKSEAPVSEVPVSEASEPKAPAETPALRKTMAAKYPPRKAPSAMPKFTANTGESIGKQSPTKAPPAAPAPTDPPSWAKSKAVNRSVKPRAAPPSSTAPTAPRQSESQSWERSPIFDDVTPQTEPLERPENPLDIDWSKSFYGVATQPVTPEQFESLTKPLKVEDVEIKSDGVLYLPEIKYRRRLNEVFGPMGWGMIPRGHATVGKGIVTREYALIIGGRFVSQAQGENNFFSEEQLPSAVEGCKSNALMRCCKDIGIGSELWDPHYVRWFLKTQIVERWVEHIPTKKKRTMKFKKGQVEVSYPLKLSDLGS